MPDGEIHRSSVYLQTFKSFNYQNPRSIPETLAHGLCYVDMCPRLALSLRCNFLKVLMIWQLFARNLLLATQVLYVNVAWLRIWPCSRDQTRY
jgi:hypothetical protein